MQLPCSTGTLVRFSGSFLPSLSSSSFYSLTGPIILFTFLMSSPLLMALWLLVVSDLCGGICLITGICSQNHRRNNHFCCRAYYLAYLSPKGHISKKKMVTLLERRYNLPSSCCHALLALVTDSVIYFDAFCHLMARFKVRSIYHPITSYFPNFSPRNVQQVVPKSSRIFRFVYHSLTGTGTFLRKEANCATSVTHF